MIQYINIFGAEHSVLTESTAEMTCNLCDKESILTEAKGGKAADHHEHEYKHDHIL